MTNCKECGLPIDACNAMAMYRRCAEEVERGRMDQAEAYAASAKAWYDQFIARYRAESR